MKTKTKRALIYTCCVLFCMCFAVLMVWIGQSTVLTAHADVAQVNETDYLTFLLNEDSKSYKVRALDKSITSITIPSSYEGLPVTDIDDSGFVGCLSLEKIVVPSSVKHIGNNAFMRCTKLKNVLGMSGVTSYGSNAFAMCSNLEYLILPNGLTSVGSSMLRNVKATVYSRTLEENLLKLNSSCLTSFSGNIVYGNELVYNKYIDPETGEEGLSLVSWQNLDLYPDGFNDETKLIIESWYSNVMLTDGSISDGKVINIEQCAFSDCNADEIIIKNSEGYNHSINLESFAFLQCNAKRITISANITLNDSITSSNSEEIFNGCESLESLILPDSIDTIPTRMFYDCKALSEINFYNLDIERNHLSNKIKRIESQAFYSCYSIPELYLTENIEFIGEYAFNYWGNNPDVYQNLYINTEKASDNWNPFWNENINVSNCNVEFIGLMQLNVQFVVEQNGVVNAIGNNAITVSRNETLNNLRLDNPVSDSHLFSGVWYTTELREEGTEFDGNKPIKTDLILYAGWDIKHFNIKFILSKYGNFRSFEDNQIIDNNIINLSYGQSYSFFIDKKIGYENYRVYKNNNLITPVTGEVFTIKVNEDLDVSFNADAIVYSISYSNLRGGTNPNANIKTYTVESNTIEFAAPIWEAYNGKTWNITSIPSGSWGDKIITAVWTNPVVYSINYANLRGGTNPNANIKTYTVESNTIEFAAPIWEAYNGKTWNITSIPSGSWGNKTITAVWTNPVVFNISYILNDNNATNNTRNPSTYTVEDNITLLDPISKGYNNGTWNIVNWSSDTYYEDLVVFAQWSNPKTFSIKIDLNGGTGNSTTIHARYGSILPAIAKPTKYDYKFLGYRSAKNNKLFYDMNMNPSVWDNAFDDTLIAQWEQEFFYITFKVSNGPSIDTLRIKYGQKWQPITMPVRKGFRIPGFFYNFHSSDWKIYNSDGTYNPNNKVFGSTYDVKENIELSGYWEVSEHYGFVVQKRHLDGDRIETIYHNLLNYEDTIEITADETFYYKTINGNGEIVEFDRGFTCWKMNFNGYQSYDPVTNPWIEYTKDRTLRFSVADIINNYYPNYSTPSGNIHFIADYLEPLGCIADDSLITLADGSQKKVQDLTGNESLLVWNLFTGTFDTAPILFIDKDVRQQYKIVNLYFSDGTKVKVIYEHAFWDFTLNKYVFLRNDADKYIGHWFNKQTLNENNELDWFKVQLVDVKITEEVTTSWSPVTYGHLCYYVNGMLSMPGATEGLINIFDVDSETLKIDKSSMQSDIEQYGLFTYEEFAEIYPITEEIFEAFNGQYLKISIGKGLITMEGIGELINHYAEFLS